MATTQLITKSIRLNSEQNQLLAHISAQEGVSEAALMQRFVLNGLAKYRLEEALTAYQQGEADLSAAAQHAQVSVYYMMSLLAERDIPVPEASDKFLQGLKSLADTFGGSDALHQTIEVANG